jgi:DeoR/GlpR family transcriptional regulator of sugar metabolism
MSLTQRQKTIVEIVKENQPIIGDEIAKRLSLTRSALRTDFSILTGKGILTSRERRGGKKREKRKNIFMR